MLILDDNLIDSISSSIFHSLNRLQVLHLARNSVADLSPAVSQLRNLRDIDLSQNQLTTIPSELIALPRIEVGELCQFLSIWCIIYTWSVELPVSVTVIVLCIGKHVSMIVYVVNQLGNILLYTAALIHSSAIYYARYNAQNGPIEAELIISPGLVKDVL